VVVLFPVGDKTVSAGYHMTWNARMITAMLRSKQSVREAFMHAYRGDPWNMKAGYVADARANLALIRKYEQQISNGDATNNIDGLSDVDYYRTMSFADACQFVDAEINLVYNLPQTCEDYNNGQFKHGINNALQTYTIDSLNLLAAIETPTLRLNSSMLVVQLRQLEMLTLHTVVIIRSIRPKFIEDAVTSHSVIVDWVVPIQIAAVAVISVFCYVLVIAPLILSFKKSNQDLDDWLMLMWSSCQLQTSKKGLAVKKSGSNTNTPFETMTRPRNTSGDKPAPAKDPVKETPTTELKPIVATRSLTMAQEPTLFEQDEETS
jgi:hypothetical protein